MNEALVIKHISNRYTLLTADHTRLVAYPEGKLKKGQSPIVGDKVHYQIKDDQVMITKVLKRNNQLIRPVIANVDQALIVMSAKKPDFSTQLIDRFIWLIRHENITPVLVITKLDLVSDDDPLYIELAEYEKSGLTVIKMSRTHDLQPLKDVVKDKISVLAGQSGVGKSSLLNRMNPDFVLKTQEISKALGRGKHTTRHVELFEVFEGWLADTPGFSALDFSNLSDLENCVIEFEPYRDQCFYRNCQHIHEPKCAVKQAVSDKLISASRYEHYLEVYTLVKQTKEKYL
jgi:ribosome biogenesis GTPase